MILYTLDAAKTFCDGICSRAGDDVFTFSLTVSPAEVRGDHAVDVDPIAQLQGDGHSEPAGAQPGV